MENTNAIFADLLKLVIEKKRTCCVNTNLSWGDHQTQVKMEFEKRIPELASRIHHACELLDNYYGTHK